MSFAGAIGVAAAVSHLTLDGDNRLLAAEPALDALNRRAGGGIGMPLAVPPLAAVARLARRLGTVVSRNVVVADEEGDVELCVRAQPDALGIRLAASGWRERAAWAPTTASAAVEHDFLAADADWTWETDALLRLTRLPIEAGRRYGFDALALIGEPLTALVELEGEGRAVPLLDALARHEPIVDYRAQLRGRGSAVSLSAMVRHDPAGRFAGFRGVARMIGSASVQGGVASMLSDTFTADLDRALRRPLVQIVADAGAIHAAASGPVPSDYADYAADIAHAGRHLLALVDDLVDLQAVEHPDFAPAADAIDLADVARRAAGLLAVQASDAGVVIERPMPGARMWARGDFRRALQILVNLIGNAIRYAPRGSIVLVDLHVAGDRMAVSIGDEGRGIAPVDQARVFEKFQRIDASEPGGNGLGLYIARRLARAMGGDLTLASMPGDGARFTLSLPADPSA
jgi:signal transduction histidine kinase